MTTIQAEKKYCVLWTLYFKVGLVEYTIYSLYFRSFYYYIFHDGPKSFASNIKSRCRTPKLQKRIQPKIKYIPNLWLWTTDMNVEIQKKYSTTNYENHKMMRRDKHTYFPKSPMQYPTDRFDAFQVFLRLYLYYLSSLCYVYLYIHIPLHI